MSETQPIEKNKGGRPPLPEGQRKDMIWTKRLTLDEKVWLEKQLDRRRDKQEIERLVNLEKAKWKKQSSPPSRHIDAVGLKIDLDGITKLECKAIFGRATIDSDLNGLWDIETGLSVGTIFGRSTSGKRFSLKLTEIDDLVARGYARWLK
jgi:hypothetical protein